MKKITGGVLTPLYSPCDEKDRFLEKEYEVHAERCLAGPVDGVYVCGGTGDGMLMSVDERKAACEIAVEVAKKYGKTVLVQIGAGTMRDSIELATHAASAGADGISSVPLSGFKHEEQMEYYKAIVSAAGIQTVLYYMPGPGREFSLSQILETLSVPGVTGIKVSSNDFFFTQQIMNACPDNIVVFNGKDEYLAPSVIHGAHGGIGLWANVFPGAYSAIYNNASDGNLKRAFEIQKELNAFCCIAMRHGLLKSFEMTLHYLGYWDRAFRRPNQRFTKDMYDIFISEAGLLVNCLTSIS